MDQDTQGVRGSGDIANTIFRKVAEADVLVADVSFVHDQATQRRTPNPNVLIELGYALGKLGDGKVICVLNLATGRIEDLPFDIRGRTVATYDLTPKATVPDETRWQELRAEQRKQLVGRLKHALLAVLSAPDPALSEFVSQMAEKPILAIIFGGEVEDRPVKPGSEEMRVVLNSVASDLRAMACQEQANRLDLANRLEEVATAIEEAIHFRQFLGMENWQQYTGLVRHFVELATTLKKEWVDTRSLGRDNLNALHRRLYEMRRELDGLVGRLPGFLQRPGGLEEAYTAAQSLGLDLCRYGEFNLDPIQPGLAARLSEIGRTLHLVGVTIDYASGSRAFQRTAEVLEQVSKDFGTLVDGLPITR